MSESSKMGLFGSKDENKNPKKENSKEDSPDRYAPYCMDNTSETYDTEALSIMDINDIIGVQSEPMADSTLESEIAALTEIITDSKCEDSQNIMAEKTVLQEEDSSKELRVSDDRNVVSGNISINKGLAQGVYNQPNVVCGSQTVAGVNNVTQPNSTTVELDKVDRDLQELKDNVSLVSNNKSNKFSIVDSYPILGNVISKQSSSKVSNDQHKDSSSEVISKDKDKIETINNLGGSLKLIGEAYTSEDSQEGSASDGDTKEDVPSDNFIEKSSIVEQKMSEDINKQSNLLSTEISLKPNIMEQSMASETEGKDKEQESINSIPLVIDKIAKEDTLNEGIHNSQEKSFVEEQKLAEEKITEEINTEEAEPSMEMEKLECTESESEAIKQDIIKECPEKLSIDTVQEEQPVNDETSSTKVEVDECVTLADDDSIACKEHEIDSLKGAININDSCETINDHSNLPSQPYTSEKMQSEESYVQPSLDVSLEDLPKKLEESEIQDESGSSTADEKSSTIQEIEHSEAHTDALTTESIDNIPTKLDVCSGMNTNDDVEKNVVPEITDSIDNEVQHEKDHIENQVNELSDASTESKTVEHQNSEISNIKDDEEFVSEVDTPLKSMKIATSEMVVKEIDPPILEETPMVITKVIEEEEPTELIEAETNKATIESGEVSTSSISAVEESNQATGENNEERIVPEETEKEIVSNTENEVLDESKNIFSTVTSGDENMIAEDLEEEAIEEEMNLTFELEEPESHTDIAENSCEVPERVKIDEGTVKEDHSGTETTKLIEGSSAEDIVETKKLTDDNNDNTEVAVDEDMKKPSMDTADNEKSDLPEPFLEETSSNIDVPMECKEQELDEKEHNKKSEETETSNDNEDMITKTAIKESELFPQEQCQSTKITDSIVEDKNTVQDLTNTLINEPENVPEVQDLLQDALDSSTVEPEVGALLEKLEHATEETSDKQVDEPSLTQNADSLEVLLDLNTISENEDSFSKLANATEESQDQESFENNVQMDQLLQKSNASMEVEQKQSDMLGVIGSCLANVADETVQQDDTETNDIQHTVEDTQPEDAEISEVINTDEDALAKAVDKEIGEAEIPKSPQGDPELPISELDMDFIEEADGSVDLEESDSKIELASDVLLQGGEQPETSNDIPSGVETSQPSSEISELESAVKFLQESEEQALDSPLVLSPKLVENDVSDVSKQTDASSLFVGDEVIGEDTSELVAELEDIATDSIAISEAEIISEAAKLENERKLAEQIKVNSPALAELDPENNETGIEKVKAVIPELEAKLESNKFEPIEAQTAAHTLNEPIPILPTLSQKVLKPSENIPKVSILEERLKEPPKIEIPISDVTKLAMSPTTTKDSLLIQKDAKLMAYQKMMESPKACEKSEPKITDTPRKDSADKHEFESVGSPRIILKIAKSAIADCAEPRSPKSPKIRSATNSPNPEDSPGQKLGKIKLKLSKGGHPSIISNENVEDTIPWHSDGTASLSPIGMKIKFSKTGDASIVSAEKHEGTDDVKDGRHKYEEIKRTESPIGMKIKLSKTGDASIIQEPKDVTKHKEKLDIMQGSPKRTESPIGMKIKLSKSGDASIIQPEKQDFLEEQKDGTLKSKDLCYDSPKRTESPIGMKIKLSKSGDASIVSPDTSEEQKETGTIKEKSDFNLEIPKRTESPIGMKIKLAKTKGGAAIISVESTEEPKEKLEIPELPKRTESPLGMKIKLSKTGDASIIHSEISEDNRTDSKEKIDVAQDLRIPKLPDASQPEQELSDKPDTTQDFLPKVESPIGMKIKLSKFGDPSIVQPTEKREQIEEQMCREPLQDIPKRTESPLGMKIKLSKTGDASIIQNDISEEANRLVQPTEQDPAKVSDSSLGMKIKLLKSGDASIVDSEKKEKSQRRRDSESPLEMKIKLSKTGHPTIVTSDTHGEGAYKPKDAPESPQSFSHRYKESMTHKESTLKILKTAHSTILQSNRSELTIEPVQVQSKKLDNAMEISPKRKEITISPIEPKKSKLETQLSQILPEVTIQPVMSRDQKQLIFDPKTSLISRQQMNVISQEISITQVRASKTPEGNVPEKLKDILSKNVSDSPLGSDCEIIEHRPELIIVNENSNSSQDVVIIEEVPKLRTPDFKANKRRGRPRRGGASHPVAHTPPQGLITNDQIAVEAIRHPASQVGQRENERPKRTCRSQKSYAPPKRGRGRGRGKRKLDGIDMHSPKRAKLDQDLSAIEASTMAVITLDPLDGTSSQRDPLEQSELYKALQQPPADSKVDKQSTRTLCETKVVGVSSGITESLQIEDTNLQEGDSSKAMPKPSSAWDGKEKDKKPDNVTEKGSKAIKPGNANWLTPPSKKQGDTGGRPENVSTVQVIDEETRMSAESSSRCQTPARNISVPASDNIVNEESQGSVLSTATTESEKVKVKNRRMEINFDPDEGPFTVDKIAEYEWPLDRKGETFMIQEQISQYLGVKSFKRKYPDLKRRMVDMEERNYLRENGLVSEAMCDMGLTAVCSSEVLDVMCSDFPDQYEEYRKHMREKQVKEHSKKQKELTAAANAEKNRIDLAEMAVQSALTWNMSLNKARKESRKCSLDLQTFTVHVPKKQQKVDPDRKVSHYPVALIPGQYTDYYREYTAAELRYYPLNTVLYGPMRPNERKFDSQSEGSQSDSDSDSSSDDSSSSSSEGTQDTEGSQSTMDDVDIEIVNQKDEIKLKCKMCLKSLNKNSKNEVLIQCGTCNGHVHPSCIDLTLDMVPHIQSYAWQCTDCKTCAQCHDPADEDKMLFCDMCDRGYHIYCVGLRRVPQGRWHCQECAVCASCGSREAGGSNSDRNSVAQWQHEYKKGDKNTRVYVSTLCVPCSKLWRKGRYCPHCSRCHTAPRLDLEVNLVHCSACDKYLHLGCVEIKGQVLDRKNYLCDFCIPNRHHVMKPLVSKTLKS